MDSYGIHFPLHLRDVDVKLVIDLTVTDIIKVSKLL